MSKQQREVEEQKIIFKLDCVNQGLNKDYSFMSNYSTCNIYFYSCKLGGHLCFSLLSPFASFYTCMPFSRICFLVKLL